MKDGRSEGDKVAKKLQELEQLMQAYGVFLLSCCKGDSLSLY